MTNIFKYLFIIGAAVLTGIGVIGMFYDNVWWQWLGWLIWIPAFLLLMYATEDYGFGIAVTLWAGYSLFFVAGYVWIVGAAWGEQITTTQWTGLGLTLVGLSWLSGLKRG